MNYTDIKNALTSLLSNGWPDNPEENTYYTFSIDLTKNVSLTDVKDALNTWLPQLPFSGLKKRLPKELDFLKSILAPDLNISSLKIYTGAESGGVISISEFKIALNLDFDNLSKITGLALNKIGLELDYLFEGTDAWTTGITASCEFFDLACNFNMLLPDGSFTLSCSQPDEKSVDKNLPSGTSLESLCQKFCSTFGINLSCTKSKITLFRASAKLSDPHQVYKCSLTLDISNSGAKWASFSLTELAISFDHGGGDTDSSFGITAIIGVCEVEGTLDYDKNKGETTFTGSSKNFTGSLSDFWKSFAAQLDITNPLPNNWPFDMELSGLSITLTHSSKETTYTIGCDVCIPIDSLGSSLQFHFIFTRSDKDTKIALQLGEGISFTLKEADKSLIFSYSGKDTLTLNDLIHLARIRPLYNLGSDISVTLDEGILVLDSNDSKKNILLGLKFTFDAKLSNALLTMITGSDDICITTPTFYVANTAKELPALSNISNFSFSAPVRRGITFLADLKIGEKIFSLLMAPPNTNNTETSDSDPAPKLAPKAVASTHATKWFNVQKQAGPVYLNRIGLSLDSRESGPLIDFLIDASFTMGSFSLTLNGFSIDVPFPPKLNGLSVDLHGMDVSYNKPPLMISGGFLNDGQGTFFGDLEIKTKSLFLAAIGEYAKKKDYTSLAFFTALTEPPLGGPVFCYITGLAAGGGYNSALKIPEKASDVASFALIDAAAGNFDKNNPFSVIENSITPKQGENWLAVGILFSSFELMQSTALLTATFGERLEFAILGQSEMSIPPASKTPIAYAQIDVEARYSPADGELSVAGFLTPKSYILSKDCHIQGGFIYLLKESGDFVISYGGYADDFDYASKGYPTVPRLKLLWNIDSHTKIKGDAYFALTPAVMMAGGQLHATWDCGIFSAWFDVGLDIMIQWQPFYYKAGFHMALGVKFDLKIAFIHVHFSFHIGARMAIEGPPFHGKAHIDLGVISFTIEFGGKPDSPKPLQWEEFRKMLPGESADDSNNSVLLSVKVTDGLRKDLSQSNTKPDMISSNGTQPDWVVNGTDFCFNIQSSLPITKASTSADVSIKEQPQNVTIGILPMEKSSTTGTLDVAIKDSNGKTIEASIEPTSQVLVKMINTDMSPAHWGTAKPDCNTQPINCTSGYIISGGIPKSDKTTPVSLDDLLEETVRINAISDRPAAALPFG